MPTIHELVASGRQRLHGAGIPAAEAEFDARLLAERLLEWDAARFFAHGNRQASRDVVARYFALVERRVNREPVAYISGLQEFWNLAFEVTPAVLIPRPETELIVESCLQLYADVDGPLHVADACTGSGCLAVALAHERRAARVTATDISWDALHVARRNVARHGLKDRVRLVCTDVLAAVRGPFDVIVSNPPYVPERDVVHLQPEVVNHEPHLALFAGVDGLDMVRRLIAESPARLVTGGHLIFEFGFGQSDDVVCLLNAASQLELVELRRDLQGIPRTAIARRTA